MIKTQAYWLCTLSLTLLSGLCHAEEATAGMIKKSRGQVTIERSGQALPAVVGTVLLATDKLRTGADGWVGLTLRDNTLMSAGPNTLMSIDKFSYDTTTNEGAMSVGVRKGTLSVATGKIAKKTPESIDFHTPTTVLGVRGTEFLVSVEGQGDE